MCGVWGYEVSGWVECGDVKVERVEWGVGI